MPLVQTSRDGLEALLRARRLDRTLTTSLAPLDPRQDEYVVGATGVTAFDACVGGGFPRGQLSEIAGRRSSGRASLVLRLLAAATARGELVALVDALDMLDVASASAAGVDLDRLLWIRGHVVSHPGLCHDTNQRAMEQAIRALSLVLSAGNFGLVVFDAGEAPSIALARLPFTTWLRLQRMVEGGQTICVLVGSEPMARSAAGLTVRLELAGQALRLADARSGQAGQVGVRFDRRLFVGLDCDARIVCARRGRPVLDTREHNGASASGLGVGPQANKERWSPPVNEGSGVTLSTLAHDRD